MKYYGVRILAGFLFMGSVGAGFLIYAKYGKWAGLVTFIILAIFGVILHKVADKLSQKDKF